MYDTLEVEGREHVNVYRVELTDPETGAPIVEIPNWVMGMAWRDAQEGDETTVEPEQPDLWLLATADGVGIVTENLFSGRFRYVDELRRMGADIRVEGHHAVVRGQERLSGAPVKAHDIRAGAAMVVAGLAAEGETRITGVRHIDRGYDDLVGRLATVGADVQIVPGTT